LNRSHQNLDQEIVKIMKSQEEASARIMKISADSHQNHKNLKHEFESEVGRVHDQFSEQIKGKSKQWAKDLKDYRKELVTMQQSMPDDIRKVVKE